MQRPALKGRHSCTSPFPGVPPIPLLARTAALTTIVLLSACGQGNHDDATPTVSAAPEIASAPVATSATSAPSAPSTVAGLFGEYAYCYGYEVIGGLGEYAKTASVKAMRALSEEPVSEFILKLQASNPVNTTGTTGTTNTDVSDTNDPIRVETVLRRALASAATRYPDNVFATAGAQAAVQIHHQMSGGATVIAFGREVQKQDTDALLDSLRLDPLVDYVELDGDSARPNAAAVTDAMGVPSAPTDIPNDRFYHDQWNLHEPLVGINAPAAWALQKADPRVITAIVDSGYFPHRDLDGNRLSTGLTMLASHRLVNTDAIDLMRGGHGTSVAGTLSAVTDNLDDLAGVGWNAKFVPINVFPPKQGASTADISDAIRWAAGITFLRAPVNPLPAKIINLSISARGSCPRSMQSAINDAVNRGVSVVAGAGNSNLPSSWFFPANCQNIITVAATNRQGQRVWVPGYFGSNYGQAVTVSAPGIEVLTIGVAASDPTLPLTKEVGGTSFSAPQVSGVIALMLSANPSLTPAQVKQILQTTAKKPKLGINEQRCTQPEGAGIVDAGAAVLAAISMRKS